MIRRLLGSPQVQMTVACALVGWGIGLISALVDERKAVLGDLQERIEAAAAELARARLDVELASEPVPVAEGDPGAS